MAAQQASDIYKQYLTRVFHPVGSSGLRVINAPGLGAGLVAARDYQEGELILVEQSICACLILSENGGEVASEFRATECECCFGVLESPAALELASCGHCGATWCCEWCRVRSSALHDAGGCVSLSWRSFMQEARIAENEYFVLAAKLFVTLEACCSGTDTQAADTDTLQADLPWSHFVGVPWWELLSTDEGALGAQKVTRAQCTTLQDLLPKLCSVGLLTFETFAFTMGMLAMNVTAAEATGGRQVIALYPLQSRINHSCNPSALMTSDDTGGDSNIDYSYGFGMAMLRAQQAIKSGGIVTIDYDGAGGPQTEKRRRLEQNYRFECNCSLCTAQNM